MLLLCYYKQFTVVGIFIVEVFMHLHAFENVANDKGLNKAGRAKPDKIRHETQDVMRNLPRRVSLISDSSSGETG